MMKINNLQIAGLRGVKTSLNLGFEGNSALLYGDNGSGKSTIADVVEWFFNDKVEHLTGEEIGRSGVEALRHIDLTDDDVASANFEFSEGGLRAEKKIEIRGSQVKSKFSNGDDSFKEYVEKSKSENLILRYRDLTRFVLATKTERLEALSNIIGYKEITSTRDILKSSYNNVQREIKAKDFSRSISEYQQEIIESFGQNITSDEQFLDVTRDLVSKLDIEIEIKSLGDVNAALRKIGKPDNSELIKKEAFLSRIIDSSASFHASFTDLSEQYEGFHKSFLTIVSDVSNFRKLLLGNLLTNASDLLGNDAYDVDECPVCLTEMDRAQLKKSVDERISELTEIREEQSKLREFKDAVRQRLSELVGKLQSALDEAQANEDWFSEPRQQIVDILEAVQKYGSSVDVRPAIDATIRSPDELKIDLRPVEVFRQRITELRKATRDTLNADPSWEVYNKINNAGRAYAAIRRLNSEKARLEQQSNTLEICYREFLERQKKSLGAFLETFSGRIQQIYQYMNPGEKVENIKLVPLEKNDELVGVTFQLDFLDHESVSPPHKFLSESHLNCFGIAFFLASADAFNKKNGFLILDDVISSFDENHRKRFADLLSENYNHYQLILLTHEKGWFQLVRNSVRSKNWFIDALRYSEANGTEIGAQPRDLLEAIEAKIAQKDAESLAVFARKYLERLLKEIALNLEVRVPFRRNTTNEDRMAGELLSDLRSHLNRRKCKELKGSETLSRLEVSTFIGNKDSHDSSFNPGFADAKAFWDDVRKFESEYLCSKCGTYVSTRYHDVVNRKISCKSGDLLYSWDK